MRNVEDATPTGAHAAARATRRRLARDNFGKIVHWFVLRGGSEELMPPESFHALGLLRSSWTLRVVLATAAFYAWPRLLYILPLLALGYYGATLRRYHFAR